MRVAATNQLSALLDAHWPGARAIFADVESPVSLEFLTRYPTPAAAAHLGEKRMAAFCVKHGYCGRRTAASCSPACAPRPAGTSRRGAHRGTARRRARRGRRAQALNASVKNLDRSVAAHLGEHPDGAIFTSLPRSGQVNAAQVLAEWGDCPPSLRAPRLRRRPRRGHPRHQRIRQAPRRALPLGLQQAVPRRDHHLRRQQPPRQPLGREDLQRRPRQRQRPPARHAHPGPRLDPRHLALLARRRPLRAVTTFFSLSRRPARNPAPDPRSDPRRTRSRPTAALSLARRLRPAARRRPAGGASCWPGG